MADVLVLPAGASLVHGVAEGHARVGVGEAQRAAGAEVAERARAGAERPLGHRELEAQSEARGTLQDEVLAVDLWLAGACDRLRCLDVNAVQPGVARMY